MRFYPLLLTLILSIVASALSCRPRNPSSLSSFNARSKGYKLKFKGEIDLTLPPNLREFVRFNLEANKLTYPTDGQYVLRIKSLETPELSDASLKMEIQSLKLNDVEYMVQQQLQHSIYVDGARITSSIEPGTVTYKERQGKPNVYDYEVTVDLNPQGEGLIEKLKERSIYYPRNLSTIFDSSGIKSLSDVQKSASAGKRNFCFTSDEHPVAPFNYFNYFNPYDNKECLEKYKNQLFEIKNPQIVVAKERVVYPEFHELFADQKMTFAFALGRGNPPWSTRNYETMKNTLLARGYKKVGAEKPFDITLARTIQSGQKPVQFEVRIFHREEEKAIRKEFQEGVLRNSEFIAYSGHSGYGSTLFDIFDKKSEFPRRKYQIYFPRSCSSFSYAVSHIIGAKSLFDLDTSSYYVDTIATSQASTSNYAAPVFDRSISFFEEAAENYWTDNIKKFSYQYLYNELDRVDHENPDLKAVYTISGAEANVFDPYKPRDQNKAPEQNANDALSFVERYIALRAPNSDSDSVIRGLAERIALYYPELLPILLEKSSSPLLVDPVMTFIEQAPVNTLTEHCNSLMRLPRTPDRLRSIANIILRQCSQDDEGIGFLVNNIRNNKETATMIFRKLRESMLTPAVLFESLVEFILDPGLPGGPLDAALSAFYEYQRFDQRVTQVLFRRFSDLSAKDSALRYLLSDSVLKAISMERVRSLLLSQNDEDFLDTVYRIQGLSILRDKTVQDKIKNYVLHKLAIQSNNYDDDLHKSLFTLARLGIRADSLALLLLDQLEKNRHVANTADMKDALIEIGDPTNKRIQSYFYRLFEKDTDIEKKNRAPELFKKGYRNNEVVNFIGTMLKDEDPMVLLYTMNALGGSYKYSNDVLSRVANFVRTSKSGKGSRIIDESIPLADVAALSLVSIKLEPWTSEAKLYIDKVLQGPADGARQEFIRESLGRIAAGLPVID
jgi:hypothetical protein